jgi:hypothetical protein
MEMSAGHHLWSPRVLSAGRLPPPLRLSVWVENPFFIFFSLILFSFFGSRIRLKLLSLFGFLGSQIRSKVYGVFELPMVLSIRLRRGLQKLHSQVTFSSLGFLPYCEVIVVRLIWIYQLSNTLFVLAFFFSSKVLALHICNVSL